MGGVIEADPAARLEGLGQGGRELAHEAHRAQAGGPRREAEACPEFDQGQRRPARGQVKVRYEAGTGGQPLHFGLRIRDHAVAIRVDREARLEGWNLGLVDHHVEDDPGWLDPDPGIVVDREVAEGMGGGDGRQQDHQANREEQRPGRSGDHRAGSAQGRSMG